MLCEHSIVWNNFIGIINMRRRRGITGQKGIAADQVLLS